MKQRSPNARNRRAGLRAWKGLTLASIPMLALAIFILPAPLSQAYAQLAAGDSLVVDHSGGTGSNGALFRVNPTTGARTLLSDFGNAAQGPQGSNPDGVAVEASGSVLVIDQSAGTNGDGALFRVDPSTGTFRLRTSCHLVLPSH